MSQLLRCKCKELGRACNILYLQCARISDFNIFKKNVNLRDKKTIESLRKVLQLTRKQKLFLIFGSVFGSASFIGYQVTHLNQKLNVISNAYETERVERYIIPAEPLKLDYDDIFPSSKRRRIRYNVDKYLHKVLPWFQSKSEDPALLLKLTESSDPEIRRMGLKALVDKDNWGDHHFRKVAQACTDRTMVSLARLPLSDYRFFRPMPWLPPPKASISKDFHSLLTKLQGNDVHDSIKQFTAKVLLETKPKNIVETGGWLFVDVPLMKTTTEKADGVLEIFLLQALVHHTVVPEQCVKMVEAGGLSLLQRIYLQYSPSLVMRRLIAYILANLTLHTQLHMAIIQGGWVAVLHRWMETTDTALLFHTARALANLDRDWQSDTKSKAVYDNGVYLAHPIYRSKDKMHNIKTDIVFVHGLLGGPFKTWRQEDRRHTEPDFVVTDEVKQEHTFFWPKDWLAKDIPGIRVVNVGYETELTMWNANLPMATEKRSLSERAADLLEKLKKADVGSRPVIWVGHSMGGLLIKEILNLANSGTSYSELSNNTLGVIFYSTPHHGASLASYSKMAKYMVFPSQEVQELDKDNPKLKALHENFVQLVSSLDIPCLSFGETEKTSIGMKLKLAIVPLESADPGIGQFVPIPSNHINICKPKNKDAAIYQKTVMFMRKCIFHERLPQHIKEVVQRLKTVQKEMEEDPSQEN